MSIAKAACEDRKEALKAIIWVYGSESFSATKYFYPANLMFSRDIFTKSLNYCLQMMRKVATEAGRVKAAGNNVIARNVVLGQAVRDSVWFRFLVSFPRHTSLQ